MLINVLFSDDSKKTIQGYFGSPQDQSAWPNYGQVDSSDARWASYYNSIPTEMRVGLPEPT